MNDLTPKPRSPVDQCEPDEYGRATHDYECTYEGMDGERYRCKKCGASYFMDYEEMR